MALMIRCNKYEGSAKTIPVNRGKIFLNGFKFFITPSSIMIVEVVRTNFRLLLFFLQENFTSIKSIKSIYKRISDFLKHKTLNKQLSLRCFYEHKKHKTLFMSTKSYAQDVVYMSTRWAQNGAHRCCLWAQMSTDEHKMMHTDIVYWGTR